MGFVLGVMLLLEFFFGPVDVVPRKKGERELRKGKKENMGTSLEALFWAQEPRGK